MSFIFGIAKEILINPILKQMEKEVKEENKRYDKMMEIAEHNIMIENELRQTTPRVFEVSQPYDVAIHEHDFW